MKKLLLGTAVTCAGFAGAAQAGSHSVSACLITKTDTNPFFVKMREGATAKAEELGVALNSYAGKVDGDNETQVQAVETCIANGAKGILITASDTSGIVPSLVGEVEGCVFRTRCPHAVAECRGDIPKREDGNHAFRCIFPDGKRHSEKELTV